MATVSSYLKRIMVLMEKINALTCEKLYYIRYNRYVIIFLIYIIYPVIPQLIVILPSGWVNFNCMYYYLDYCDHPTSLHYLLIIHEK